MPLCQLPGCNNEVERTKLGEWKKHCSTKCRGQHNSIIGSEKRKQTCLEKFGATTNLKTAENRLKTKATLMKNYGVEHQMQLDSVKQKIKNTCIETYGVDNPSKSASVKEKKVSTSFSNFGTMHPLQSPNIQEKRREKSLMTHGVDHYSKTDAFKIGHPNQSHILPENFKKLKDPAWLLENNTKSCVHIAEMLGVTKSTVAKSFNKYHIPHTSSYTYGELAIVDFIKTIYSGAIITQSRKIISPKELDIYLPDVGLAIEYDGLYWHSDINGKDRKYHLNKTQECNAQNIRLIHVFDTEWENKQEIVKSRISNMLKRNNTVHARKCSLITLTSKEHQDFFNKTHIQGAVGSTIAYGLVYNGTLVAAMSFGKARFNKLHKWELLRFSNELNISVAGAASKLFSHFVKTMTPDTIVSYSDCRWNTGSIYRTLGFIHNGESPPNYWYTRNYSLLESRVKYQKHKLEKLLPVFDNNKSEWENMIENGYDRVWDCGNSVYVWTNPQVD